MNALDLPPSPEAMLELKRIFGTENVYEDLVSHRGNKRWCYVVKIEPSPELKVWHQSHPDYTRRGQMGLNMEKHLVSKFQGLVEFPNIQLYLRRFRKRERDTPVIFTLPVDEMEKPEALAALKRLSWETMMNAVANPAHGDLRSMHLHALQSATGESQWLFISGRDGEGYQSITPFKHPAVVQLALLDKLGLKDKDYFVETKNDGFARIPLKAMLHGNVVQLMESILPEAYLKSPSPFQQHR
jgi:hypothetical protein